MVATGIKNQPTKRVAIFFIGGAGDKRPFLAFGPNNNVEDAITAFYIRAKNMATLSSRLDNSINYHYLGYYEVFGEKNIQLNIIANLQSKADLIYIIGHSLGGWNGAHLTNLLSTKGYQTTMLITLDPVGTQGVLATLADIYFTTPTVRAEYWINIRATPPKRIDSSDVVAKLGGQWQITVGPNINKIMAINHLDAGRMFTNTIHAEGSALDIMLASIIKHLQLQP